MKCEVCSIIVSNGIHSFGWNIADQRVFRPIPLPPKDLVGAALCTACYHDGDPNFGVLGLEERVRAARAGNRMAATTATAEWLYVASSPRWKTQLSSPVSMMRDEVVSTKMVRMLSNLTFALDVKRLHITTAVMFAECAHRYRQSLPMYGSFFEQCRKKFRGHYDWPDLARYAP